MAQEMSINRHIEYRTEKAKYAMRCQQRFGLARAASNKSQVSAHAEKELHTLQVSENGTSGNNHESAANSQFVRQPKRSTESWMTCSRAAQLERSLLHVDKIPNRESRPGTL